MPQEIKGVNTEPATRDPRRMGHAEIAGGHVETILTHTRPDGSTGHGINPDAVHDGAAKARYRDGEQHRADLRGGKR